MRLFVIRNTTTALIANSIIEKENIDASALIIIHDTTNNIGFKKSITLILERSKWTKILFLDQKKLKLVVNSFDKIKSIFQERKLIKQQIKYYSLLLDELKISEVILSCTWDIINERTLLQATQNKLIAYSFYEQGLDYFYQSRIFDSKIISNNSYYLKKITKTFLYHVILRKYNYHSEIMDFSGVLNYYTLFLNIFPYKNKIKPTKVDLQIYNNKYILKAIFFTSSLSEDKIISLEDEIALLYRIWPSLPKPIFIKFHPRDSKIKKEIIIKKFDFKPLPIDLENAPAEDLINSSETKFIGGYITTTLFIATQITMNARIISYVGLINDNVINKNYLKKIKVDFPTIDFVLKDTVSNNN